MLFNSFNFWIVFPFIFAVYWIIPIKYTSAKKGFLILVSYLLYMNFKPAYALILFGITVVTYVVALYLESAIASAHIKRRRIIVWTGVVLATLPLIVFKYYKLHQRINIQCNGGYWNKAQYARTQFGCAGWYLVFHISGIRLYA